MAFPASLTIVCVLLSLVPGWLFLRRLERIRPASNATGLNEILQVLAVGLSTTGLAVLIVILLPRGWLVDPVALVKGGRAYVLAHLQRVALSITATFLLAIAIAYLFSWVRSVGGPKGFDTVGNPWVSAFNASPKGKHPWLIVEMADGRRVDGWLKNYDPDKDTKPDIVLQGRIHVTPSDGGERSELKKANRFIVVGDQVVTVTIFDLGDPPDPPWWQTFREKIRSNGAVAWQTLQQKIRGKGVVESGEERPLTAPAAEESTGG